MKYLRELIMLSFLSLFVIFADDKIGNSTSEEVDTTLKPSASKKIKHISSFRFDSYSAHIHWSDSCTESICIVKNSDHRVVQNISLKGDTDNLTIDMVSPEGTIKGTTYKVLEMIDYDKDGYNDLRILSAWGSRGGQESYKIWKYHPEDKKFYAAKSNHGLPSKKE